MAILMDDLVVGSINGVEDLLAEKAVTEPSGMQGWYW